MPQNSLHISRITKNISPNFKNQLKSVSKQKEPMNIFQNMQTNSQNSNRNKQNLNTLRTETANENAHNTRSKSFKGRSLAKKLFQKAKMVKDPQKQTYLSPQSKYGEKNLNILKIHSTKQSELLDVPNLQKGKSPTPSKRCLIPKASKSPSNIEITQAYGLARGNNMKSKTTPVTEDNSFLTIDKDENQWIQQNNLFKSIEGKDLLNSLEKKLQTISSIEKKVSSEGNIEKEGQSKPVRNPLNVNRLTSFSQLIILDKPTDNANAEDLFNDEDSIMAEARLGKSLFQEDDLKMQSTISKH